MYCKNCGKLLPDNAKFCNYCGNAVTPVKSAASPDYHDEDATIQIPSQNPSVETEPAPEQTSQVETEPAPEQTSQVETEPAPEQTSQVETQPAPQQNAPFGNQQVPPQNTPFGAQQVPPQNTPFGTPSVPQQNTPFKTQQIPPQNTPFNSYRPVAGNQSGFKIPVYLIIIIIAAIAAVIGMIIFFVMKSNKSNDDDIITEMSSGLMDESVDSGADISSGVEENESTDENISGAEEMSGAEEASEYIIPDSDTRVITESDLEGLDEDQLRIARNELYARHGRLFNDEQLQAYFNNCSWYHGEIQPDDFTDDMLSDIERQNKDTIVAYEEKMGYR